MFCLSLHNLCNLHDIWLKVPTLNFSVEWNFKVDLNLSCLSHLRNPRRDLAFLSWIEVESLEVKVQKQSSGGAL